MTRFHLTAAAVVIALLSVGLTVSAHPGHEDAKNSERGSASAAVTVGESSDTDRLWLQPRRLQIQRLNTEPNVRLLALRTVKTQPAGPAQPSIAKYFDQFRKRVDLRWDKDFLYVESNGLPDHDMMVGITAWQQQVPLPQRYVGSNAWQIPLYPVPARNPMSAKTNFFRGAIALAVNGVPIFNPIKNDGRTDTLIAGELDKWGGHCGRGDDYHYHVAPVHLQKLVGKGKPLAFALDGYPLYGYEEADGSQPRGLDRFNGHKDAAGNYHYHATKTYPYINGGFYGEVVERGGQVDPQPRAQGLRPATSPLRGAKITGFTHPKPGSYRVEYDVYGDKRSISYDVSDDGSAEFRFTDRSGTRTQSYQPRSRGGGDQDPILRAFDRNRDGTIDRDELSRAPKIIGLFDRNNDGKITREELRGEQEGRQRPGPRKR